MKHVFQSKFKSAAGALAFLFLAVACGVPPNENDPIEASNQPLVTGIDLTFMSIFNNERVWGEDLLVMGSYIVQNLGTVTSKPAVVKFYLSTDKVLNSGDIHLLNCDASIPALASNADTGFIDGSCTVPTGTPKGAYWVLGQVDATGTNAEAVEANNVQVFPDQYSVDQRVYIGPDLDKSSQLLPSVYSTNVLSLYTVLRNQGSKAVGPTNVTYYLSIDNIIGAGDIFLCTVSAPSVRAGGNTPITPTCSLSSTLTGKFYVLARMDSANYVAEVLENNNDIQGYSQISAGIDLAVPYPVRIGGNPRLSAFDVGGGQVAINYGIENAGTRPSLASTSRYYLSTDTVLDSLDKLLCTISVGPLAPKTGSLPAGGVPTTRITCPTGGVSIAGKYIIEVLDATNTNVEASETNNRASDLIKAKPDYTLTSLTATYDSIYKAVKPTVIIKNQGNAAITHTSPNYISTSFRLSLNTTLDASDIPLQCASVLTTLAVGASVTSSPANCTVPAGVHGSYYVLALTDTNDIDKESNEVNNLRATATPITLP